MRDHEGLWGIMGDHGGSWGIMGDHGGLWGIMGDHGGSWGIMGINWCTCEYYPDNIHMSTSLQNNANSLQNVWCDDTMLYINSDNAAFPTR